MSDDVPEADRSELPDLDEAYPEVAAWLAAHPAPVMPADVWDRLESVLAEQSPLSTPGVIPLHGATRRRQRRVVPLLGAAAGLVLVGAVGIPVVLGGSAANQPVADGMTTASTAVPSDPVAAAPSASTPDPEPTTAPSTPAQPSPDPGSDVMAVPARLLVASGTDYSAGTMAPQVTSLLSTAGITDGADLAEDVVTIHSSTPRGLPPLIGGDGFTADVDQLRDCLGRLHAARGGDAAGVAMPALLVDRAAFDGSDAGVVVMLHTEPGRAPYLDVAVVGPECTDADVAGAVWFRYDLP